MRCVLLKEAVLSEPTMMDTSQGLEVEKIGCMSAWAPRRFFFGLGCPREFAALFGLVYGGAFDSRSDWNSSDKIARRKCLQVVNEMNPLFVLG